MFFQLLKLKKNIKMYIFEKLVDTKKYPMEYHDRLGRLVYCLDNEFERTVFVYYGDTGKLKVKYQYFNKDVYFDVFSKTGELVFSSISNNIHQTNIERKHDGSIDFIVNPKKLSLINGLK